MKHKVADLEGHLLDLAVAMCESRFVYHTKETLPHPLNLVPAVLEALPCWLEIPLRGDSIITHKTQPTAPPYSTRWQIGGPIIDRERIALVSEQEWNVDSLGRGTEIDPRGRRAKWKAVPFGFECDEGIGSIHDNFRAPEEVGPTALIAAMRAYVASKFGDEVELP